ncbi:MAG TPA: YgiQ family radical SAM protein [Saprospiraceae bacterium]|nr:YgiQ family radical SAM protein [Saprospiraceae bacterium]
MKSPQRIDWSNWLPITKKELQYHGWEDVDVVLITGDAYVDHPAFGAAVIGRIIQREGFRVAIVPQPSWNDDWRDFKKFGKPNYFFAVTSGNMDSMINHYTANKRRRSEDAYTPGGDKGFRPDYATTVYTQILKELYPDTPVLIGGIEASLRRVTHYDYWSDQLMPSILKTTGADLMIYGMGEKPLVELLRLLKKGVPFHSIKNLKQTAYLSPFGEALPKVDWEDVQLHSHENCLKDKIVFASNFKTVEIESNKIFGRRILQQIGEDWLVINPSNPPMTETEIDASFELPFTRLPHPKYSKRGPIPAYEMIKFSVNMHRGCFGGCSFCTISAHQGKFIASRSENSILTEVDAITKMPDFKGYITDLGGPSANMYKMKGKIQSICDKCQAPSCISPVVCSNLDTSHDAMTNIYRKVDAHPKIKKATIGSGIRYDLLVKEFNKKGDSRSMREYMTQLVTRHISGRLKVAPEHGSDATLKVMRKPSFKYFFQFKKMYDKVNQKAGLKQPLIPYFISSHPGCQEEDMADLAAKTKDLGFRLEQVQGFTPTPMTVATVIYYSGVHPYTLKPMYTAKTRQERDAQHQFFFWYKGEFRQKIKARLAKLGRLDLAEILLGGRPKNTPQKDKKKNNQRHGKSRRPSQKPSNKRRKRR